MVRRLLASFDLAEADAGVFGGVVEHPAEQVVTHEVGARTGREVTAAGQEFHGFQVDFLVAPDGVVDGMARFGEGRRVEDDEIIVMALVVGQVGQEVEDVGLLGRDDVFQAVAADIFVGHVDGFLGNVDGCDAGRPALGCIEGKGSGMGEAVQDMLAGSDFGDSQAIVFLVQEESRLLAIFHIDIVEDAVFVDGRQDAARLGQKVGLIPAFILFHAIQFADFDVVPFINASDGDAHGGQFVDESLEDDRFDLVHAVAQGLGDEDVVIAVYGQARHVVGVAEDEAAAGEVFIAHDGLAVVQGIFDPALPESFVEAVVGIARHDAHTYLRNVVGKARAEISVFVAVDVDDVPCLVRAFDMGHFFAIYPGVAAAGSPFPLLGNR